MNREQIDNHLWGAATLLLIASVVLIINGWYLIAQIPTWLAVGLMLVTGRGNAS